MENGNGRHEKYVDLIKAGTRRITVTWIVFLLYLTGWGLFVGV